MVQGQEIIAGRLKRERGHTVIGAETLYDFIYNSEIGKRDKLYEYLPRGKKRRSKKKGRKSQRYTKDVSSYHLPNPV